MSGPKVSNYLHFAPIALSFSPSLPPSLSAQLFLKLSHFAYGKTEAQGVFSGPFPLPHTRGPILEVQNLKPATMSKAYEVFEN